MKIDGRCHCGYVTFEAEADPETATVCNCTDCQTMSGAPLRAVIITRPGAFVLLSGNPTEYRKTADTETFVCKVSALIAGRRSMRHRLTMGQKPTTCGLDRSANEMNCRHGGRYLFAHNRDGSTTSTQFRNLTACPIDRHPAFAARARRRPLLGVIRTLSRHRRKTGFDHSGHSAEPTPLPRRADVPSCNPSKCR